MVILFEDLAEYLKQHDKEQQKVTVTFLRMWNRYMKGISQINQNPFNEFEGLLNYKKIYKDGTRDTWRHLAFTRGEIEGIKGFCIFTLFDHEIIDQSTSLCTTYISYLPSNEWFFERRFFFYLKEDGTIQLDNRDGFWIFKTRNNEQKAWSITPFFGGNKGTNPVLVPHSERKGFFFYGFVPHIIKDEDTEDNPLNTIGNPLNTVTIEDKGVEDRLLPSLKEQKETVNTNIPTSFIQEWKIINWENSALTRRHHLNLTQTKQFYELTSAIDAVLEEKLYGFLPLPTTEVHHKEVALAYLISLREQKNFLALSNPTPDDNLSISEQEEVEDILDFLDSHQLDQLIEESKIDLHQAYLNEIRQEQEEIRKKVVNNDYDGLKGGKKLKKKKKSKKSFQKRNKNLQENSLPVLNEESQQINEEAKKLLESFVDQKNGQIKWRTHRKWLNAAIKIFRKQGISFEGELNKSSHGALKMENSTVAPIYRPHGKSKENSVSARATCQFLKDISTKSTEFLRQQEKVSSVSPLSIKDLSGD